LNIYSADRFPPCDLWDYAIEIYDETKVSEACLSLQSSHGIDVNLLLFCLWSGACCGRKLTVNDFSQALDISENWQLPIVVPLRKVRNALKSSNSPIDEKFTQELRRTILKSELYAERLELKMLGDVIENPVKDSVNGQSCADSAAENLTTYLKDKIEKLNQNDVADILAIWQTAFPNAKDTLLVKLLSAD